MRARRLVALLVCALAALSAFAVAGRAARDIVTGALPGRGVEVVVYEARGCIYCELFRRDVVPAFQASSRGRVTPLRFVDIEAVDRAVLPKNPPIAMLPTAIIVQEGREIGRIDGYSGPDTFQAVLTHLLGPVLE